MVDPTVVGYSFRPTDLEIVEKYLRPKNDPNSDTSHVDRVMTTVKISNLDPKELRSQSEDQVWYFFGRKENKFKRGDRQVRKTKSGFWKKTGKPTDIKRKVGEKIGEKWILTFHMSKNLDRSKTKWVMHEYHLFSPNKVMKYTVCKVMCKGEASEISSPSPSSGIDNPSPITQMNNSGELSAGSEVGTSFACPQTQEIENPQHLRAFIINMPSDEWNNNEWNNLEGLSTRSEMGTSFECPQSQELENPLELSDYSFEDMQFEDTMGTAISHPLSDDDNEQRKVMSLQENRNDHRPKKPITGVLNGYSSDDDSDSELISSTTGSIQTSSTCEDSFGSSDHLVDQITELQESRNSIIKYEKVNQTPGQENKIGGDELGQEKIKNKRGCFFYRIIQRFIRKIQLCTSIN